MTEERLILDGTIYPELRKFCRKHSYDLHIIDLNIDDEQFKYKDWMDEIKIAHSESTGVGFLVCFALSKLIKSTEKNSSSTCTHTSVQT